MSTRTWLLRLRDLAGALAVLGTLALWPAAVSVARADSAQTLPEGPMCKSAPSPEPVVVGMQRWISALAARADRQPGASANGEEVVVLDNAGYRYRPVREAAPPPAAPDSGRGH